MLRALHLLGVLFAQAPKLFLRCNSDLLEFSVPKSSPSLVRERYWSRLEKDEILLSLEYFTVFPCSALSSEVKTFAL